MTFNPTEEQLAISEAIAPLDRNIGVDAGAGTGKSTTAKWVVREKVKPTVSVLFCVFNRKNKLELEDYTRTLGRRNVAAKTFNGMGFSAMMKALSVNADRIDLDDSKYRRLAEEYIDGYALVSSEDDKEEDKRQERDDAVAMLEKLIHFFMVNTTFEASKGRKLKVFLGNQATGEIDLAEHDPSNADTLLDIATRYDLGGLQYPQNERAVIDAVPKLIEKGEALMLDKTRYWVSFTEQIYWTVVKGWRVWGSQLVIVDEAQDLSPLERALVDMHVYWQGNGHVMFIGDPQQAIYAFKGADNAGFQNSMKFWDVEKAFPLTLSRRCPKKIARLAQDHKAGYRSTDDALDGVIEVITEQKLLDMAQPGDALISRVRSPMISWWRRLVAAGKPATILGGDISKSIISILKDIAKRKDFRFEALDDLLAEYEAKKIERMTKAKKSEPEIANFRDQMAAVSGAIEAVPDAKNIDSLIDGIKAIFKKDDGEEKDKILIMTGHGSKGLEFKRVFNVTPDRFPLTWQNQSASEYEQELNLDYVQKTRTIESYYYVTNDDELRKRLLNELRIAFDQPKLFDIPVPPPKKSESSTVVEEFGTRAEWQAEGEAAKVSAREKDPINPYFPPTPEHLLRDFEALEKSPLAYLLHPGTPAPKPVELEPTHKPHRIPDWDRRCLTFEYNVLLAKYGKLTEGQRERLTTVREELGLCKFKQPQPELMLAAAA